MKNKANIKTMYCIDMFFIIFSLIGAHVGAVILFVFFSNKKINLLLFFIFIIFLLITIILCLKELILYLKDYHAYKKEEYLEVCGLVIAFEKNRDTESGIQINSKPIIRTDEGNTIVLKVNCTLEIGKKYSFFYLKYSKIAEVKPENLFE